MRMFTTEDVWLPSVVECLWLQNREPKLGLCLVRMDFNQDLIVSLNFKDKNLFNFSHWRWRLLTWWPFRMRRGFMFGWPAASSRCDTVDTVIIEDHSCRK